MNAQAQTIADQPDLTLALDATTLWPDPESCPDWPLYRDNLSAQMNSIGGRKDAEDRLQALGGALNRGPGRLVPPTKAMAERALAEHFSPGNAGNWRWDVLGLTDKRPSRATNQVADLIVEAAHIRGYLRKLDARTKRAAQEAAEREELRARQTLVDFNAHAKRLVEEYASLADAAQRHQQRLDDEKAFGRRSHIPQELSFAHFDACRAASKLGVERPELPTFA